MNRSFGVLTCIVLATTLAGCGAETSDADHEESAKTSSSEQALKTGWYMGALSGYDTYCLDHSWTACSASQWRTFPSGNCIANQTRSGTLITPTWFSASSGWWTAVLDCR